MDAPDERAPASALSPERSLNEPTVDAGFIERLSARMPESRRAEMVEHWAGRPIDERSTYEKATDEDWALVRSMFAHDRERDWREFVATHARVYADARPSALAADQHRSEIEQWWASDKRLLYLRGKPGGGKTYAAYAIANAVCHHTWCEAVMLSELLATVGERSDEFRNAWRSAVRCELLILDDLGQESTAGWRKEEARDLLHRLLSARETNERRTVITTNQDGDWIAGTYGSAIVDRLAHDAVGIEFTGASRRQAKNWGNLV